MLQYKSNLSERIYIMGFMGCGKTTYGKKLAGKMGYSHLDLDQLIENQEKNSISSMFYNKGEFYFREIENKLLKSTILCKNNVISVGGGTPCSEANLDFIKKNGKSIFLNPDFEKIYSRLKSDKNRPLIQSKTKEEIEALYQSRLKYYHQADEIIDL